MHTALQLREIRVFKYQYWKGFLLELVPIAMGALHTPTQIIVSTACNPSTPTSGTLRCMLLVEQSVLLIAEVCPNLYIEV